MIFDILLNFAAILKFCGFLRRYQISSISSLSSVRWNSRNGRFASYMSPKCKISSVSKVIDFIGRWILVGLVFGRFWVYLTQNCLDSVSDLKICTIFESKLIPTSCDANTKHLIGTCSLPVRKAPWKIIAARVNHFQKPNDDTTRCVLHSIPARPS